jgi:hypothetical protein
VRRNERSEFSRGVGYQRYKLFIIFYELHIFNACSCPGPRRTYCAAHGGGGETKGRKTSGFTTGSRRVTEETPQVEISSQQQQLIGVKTVKVSLKPIQKVIRTVGRIEADERKQATINTKIEGWIEKLHVDYTGRYVKKGEPLVEIYSPELLATQQEFLGI